MKSAETEQPSGGELGRKSRRSAPWHGTAGSTRVGFEDNAWDKSRRAALGIPRQRGDVLARRGTDPDDSSGLARSSTEPGGVRVGLGKQPNNPRVLLPKQGVPPSQTQAPLRKGMEGSAGMSRTPRVWSPACEPLPPPALLLCLPRAARAAGGTGGGYIWVLAPELARPGTPPDGGICRKANIFVCFR